MPTSRERVPAFRQRCQHLARRLPPPVLAAADHEADRLAPHRSCTAAAVTVR